MINQVGNAVVIDVMDSYTLAMEIDQMISQGYKVCSSVALLVVGDPNTSYASVRYVQVMVRDNG